MFLSKLNLYIYLEKILPLNILYILQEVNKSFLFKSGLILKIFLIFFFIPKIHIDWFIPFYQNAINFNLVNPWGAHIFNNGDLLSFPYGIVMYIAFLLIPFFGLVFKDLLPPFLIIAFGIGLTTLIFDYLCLIFIALISRKYSIRLLIITYWLSPISLYVLYVHGQLDILPVLLLIASLYFFYKNTFYLSGLSLALAISAKFSMVIALPFLLIYGYRKRLSNKIFIKFVSSLSIVLVVCFLPFLNNNDYINMVLKSPQTEKLFYLFINYSSGLNLFILPTIFLVILYFIWRLERITFDLFIMSIGLGFFVLLLLLPPSPGWYLWILPFIVFYQLRCPSDYLFITLPFYLTYIIFYSFYSEGSSLLFLDNKLIFPFASFTLNSQRISSIIFTAMQASGLLICIRMFTYGIARNNFFSFGKKPLLIGISSIDESDLELSILLSNIFGNSFCKTITQNNYSKFPNKYKLKSNLENKPDNPNSYYLNKFSSDVLSLRNNNYEYDRSKEDQFLTIKNSREKLKYSFLFIVGKHYLYMKKLRDFINLKIYIEIEKSLISFYENKFNRKDINKFNNPKKYTNKNSNDYKNEQINTSDLSFKILPLKKNSSFNKNSQEPKQRLEVTMANGYFHDNLSHNLIALCSANINVENSNQIDKITLSIEADITKEDVEHISKFLIPNSEDLVTNSDFWESGLFGIIQIIIVKHIADLLIHN
mgnify:CR=1 FL=1